MSGREARRSAQSFFHRFDSYANPVSLTYNQQKSFKTVQGGICSIISAVLLTYYILVTLITHTVDLTYSETMTQTVINPSDPVVFTIPTSLLQVYSSVRSIDASVQANLDQYVGGVYIAESFNITTLVKDITYI